MPALGAALAALWLAAPAGAETRPPYGNTVEGTLLGAPVALDPAAAQSHAEITVAALVFDTLYAIGGDGAIEPHLAVGPPVLDPAGTTAHVALRHGVKFHDQAVMTAGDVVDSLERVRGAVGWLLAPISAVHASGDGIDVVLRVPGVEVASLLALPQTAITRRGQAPDPVRPVGSGPFAVDSFDRAGRMLALRAFDDHFAGRPYLNRLVLRWFDTPDAEVRRFETGQSQMSARGATVFGSAPKFQATSIQSPAGVLVFVGFGRQHAAVTGEPGFRRALDLALDRSAVATITTGELTQPTRLPLPVDAGGKTLDPAAAGGNAAAALAALDDAGRRVGALAPANRAGLTLAILVDETRPDDREIALRVARGLQKLGIGFTIQAVSAEALRDRARGGSCDLWIGQIAAPTRAAAVWWGAAFAAGNDGWAQRQLQAGAIDLAAAAQEFDRRPPIVPLMFRAIRMWHRLDVHGLAFDASARLGFADLYWPGGHP